MFSGPGANYHTDAEQAKKLGFPNIVVQGMMTTCFAAQVMLEAFGEGFLTGGRLSLKLTNVLWVDESVTARGRVRERVREGTQTRVLCEVWVDKDDGTRVLLGEASALE
jgi:acyl dehydratase